ncbi:MAG: hypothetical protein ABSE73_26955 [Planctomycetota bacterium]
MPAQPRNVKRKLATLLLVLACSAIAFPATAQSDGDADKQKKKEDSIRQEAKTLAQTVQTEDNSVSLHGHFSVEKEMAENNKPLPKVVGYLSAGGEIYPVMVAQPAALGTLLSFDNKDVSLTGKILDKGDDGKFLIVTTVVIPAGAPPAKKKRGGL